MCYLKKIRYARPAASATKSEINTLKKQSAERFGGGQQFDPNQLPDELFAEQAERRVRLGILLGATIKKLELELMPIV